MSPNKCFDCVWGKILLYVWTWVSSWPAVTSGWFRTRFPNIWGSESAPTLQFIPLLCYYPSFCTHSCNTTLKMSNSCWVAWRLLCTTTYNLLPYKHRQRHSTGGWSKFVRNDWGKWAHRSPSGNAVTPCCPSASTHKYCGPLRFSHVRRGGGEGWSLEE